MIDPKFLGPPMTQLEEDDLSKKMETSLKLLCPELLDIRVVVRDIRHMNLFGWNRAALARARLSLKDRLLFRRSRRRAELHSALFMSFDPYTMTHVEID